MRRGFTMIELIFVIVIIGILAAVAIPRMMATRDDARVSAELANIRQTLDNLGAEYTATGAALTAAQITTANSGLKCFTITKEAGDANITVAAIAAATTECPDAVLTEITTEATKTGAIGNHDFSSSNIVR